jgi:hypothetical protein
MVLVRSMDEPKADGSFVVARILLSYERAEAVSCKRQALHRRDGVVASTLDGVGVLLAVREPHDDGLWMNFIRDNA